MGSATTAATPAAPNAPEEPTATICGVIWPKHVDAKSSAPAKASGVANSFDFFIVLSPIGKSACNFFAQTHFDFVIGLGS
jgi:hypothetical protein